MWPIGFRAAWPLGASAPGMLLPADSSLLVVGNAGPQAHLILGVHTCGLSSCRHICEVDRGSGRGSYFERPLDWNLPWSVSDLGLGASWISQHHQVSFGWQTGGANAIR